MHSAPNVFQGKFPLWCERGDLNPHPIWDWILSPARLPVPPPSQKIYFIIVIYDNQREKSRRKNSKKFSLNPCNRRSSSNPPPLFKGDFRRSSEENQSFSNRGRVMGFSCFQMVKVNSGWERFACFVMSVPNDTVDPWGLNMIYKSDHDSSREVVDCEM